MLDIGRNRPSFASIYHIQLECLLSSPRSNVLVPGKPSLLELSRVLPHRFKGKSLQLTFPDHRPQQNLLLGSLLHLLGLVLEDECLTIAKNVEALLVTATLLARNEGVKMPLDGLQLAIHVRHKTFKVLHCNCAQINTNLLSYQSQIFAFVRQRGKQKRSDEQKQQKSQLMSSSRSKNNSGSSGGQNKCPMVEKQLSTTLPKIITPSMSTFTAAPMPHTTMIIGISTTKMISQQQQQSCMKGPANAPPTAARPTHRSNTPKARVRKRGVRMIIIMPISTCCHRDKFQALNKETLTNGTGGTCLPERCRWPTRIGSVSPANQPDRHSKTHAYIDKSCDYTLPSSLQTCDNWGTASNRQNSSENSHRRAPHAQPAYTPYKTLSYKHCIGMIPWCRQHPCSALWDTCAGQGCLWFASTAGTDRTSPCITPVGPDNKKSEHPTPRDNPTADRQPPP